MTPALTICPYPDCWEISCHLQVGRKTFRCFTHEVRQLEDVTSFLEAWAANWQDVAQFTWDYHGLEDITEPDLDKSTLSVNVQLALANLIPFGPTYRRKL